ncbi:MAG: enoyl-CoA hydratase [Hyphomonadaceae bacterium]
MTTDVLTTSAHGVATITLNRPEASNALTFGMRDDLSLALSELAADAAIRAVVLTGAGDRAFCGGLDRNELPMMMARLEDESGALDQDIAAIVAAHPTPVIAAVNGVAMTGGLELMLACDFALAADHARFADTHARLGIAPMWGMSQRLPRRIGASRAKQMALTGDWIDAERALSWGLVNEVAPREALMARARALAAAIAQCDADAVAVGRRLIDAGDGTNLAAGLEREKQEASAFNRAQWKRSREA